VHSIHVLAVAGSAARLSLTMCVLLAAGLDSQAAPLKSNVVLLLVDDVGYGDIDYGDGTHTSPARTPHLADMARGEHTVHFQRFYAGALPATLTSAACLEGG
jgi:arylsulfatase A-like enzyme